MARRPALRAHGPARALCARARSDSPLPPIHRDPGTTLPQRLIGAPFPHRDPTRPSPTATPGLLWNPLGAFQHPSDIRSTPENPFLA